MTFYFFLRTLKKKWLEDKIPCDQKNMFRMVWKSFYLKSIMLVDCSRCLDFLEELMLKVTLNSEMDLQMLAENIRHLAPDETGHHHSGADRDYDLERLAKFRLSQCFAFIEMRAHPIFERYRKL